MVKCDCLLSSKTVLTRSAPRRTRGTPAPGTRAGRSCCRTRYCTLLSCTAHLLQDGRWRLAGLVSQPSCGQREDSIYTDMTKFVYWVHEVVGDPGPTPPPGPEGECGLKGPGQRIVGGGAAEPGEWPWQVWFLLLYFFPSFFAPDNLGQVTACECAGLGADGRRAQLRRSGAQCGVRPHGRPLRPGPGGGQPHRCGGGAPGETHVMC